jgi:hypothetical protein
VPLPPWAREPQRTPGTSVVPSPLAAFPLNSHFGRASVRSASDYGSGGLGFQFLGNAESCERQLSAVSSTVHPPHLTVYYSRSR